MPAQGLAALPWRHWGAAATGKAVSLYASVILPVADDAAVCCCYTAAMYLHNISSCAGTFHLLSLTCLFCMTSNRSQLHMQTCIACLRHQNLVMLQHMDCRSCTATINTDSHTAEGRSLLSCRAYGVQVTQFDIGTEQHSPAVADESSLVRVVELMAAVLEDSPSNRLTMLQTSGQLSRFVKAHNFLSVLLTLGRTRWCMLYFACLMKDRSVSERWLAARRHKSLRYAVM